MVLTLGAVQKYLTLSPNNAWGGGGRPLFEMQLTKNLAFGVHFNIFDHINGMLINY